VGEAHDPVAALEGITASTGSHSDDAATSSAAGAIDIVLDAAPAATVPDTDTIAGVGAAAEASSGGYSVTEAQASTTGPVPHT
jgi:hypothetical protein